MLTVHFLDIVRYRNILSTNISVISRNYLDKAIPPFAIPKFRAAEEKFCNFRRIGVGALLRPAFENNCNRWRLTMNGGKRRRATTQVSLFSYDYRIEYTTIKIISTGLYRIIIYARVFMQFGRIECDRRE